MSPAKIWSSLPSEPGMIEKVFEIPSCASINGSFESGQSDFSKERHRIDVIFRKGSRL